MSAASMIATHMNAPYGRIVSAQDVVTSMLNGHLCASTKDANEILAALFVEVDPSLILSCATQVKAPLKSVNQLYNETLSMGLMQNPAWEEAVSAFA